VLVPVYGVPRDKVAVKILEGCFPNRKIIPVNCRVLIEQHGSLHCVSMQFPKAVRMNIKNLK
jgi:agmatine deiminase